MSLSKSASAMLAAVASSSMAPEGLVLVRAAIHLRGLRVGDSAFVDPTDPYIAQCLKAGFLVEIGEA